MNMAQQVNMPSHVLARDVGEETVILDLASGTYFGLNPVGARMWQLMREGKSLGEICAAVESEYQATRGEIERDLAKLVADLAAKGLITLDERNH